MSLIVRVGAVLTGKTIDVFNRVTIYVDGVKIESTDVNGNPVDTFIYNGTTYVPLRAVGQSLGKSVSYDGTTQSVYIGAAPGTKQYLLTVCPPYQAGGYDAPATLTMSGQKYANGCTCGYRYSSGYALFNLNGQYETLSFDIGHIDGEGMYDGEFNIYLDNELAFSVDLNGEMLPQHYEVSLNKALQMKFEMPGYRYYGIANIEIK